MKKLRQCIAVYLAVAILITSIIPVSAEQKKLKVNTIYNTSQNIKGKTKKKYLVRVKIGKKTYKKKANKKGYFSVTIPNQKSGKKITIKVYKKKHSHWRLYTKKRIIVKKKYRKKNDTKHPKYPGKEEPLDLNQINKDLLTGKKINKGQVDLGPGHYYYLMNFGGLIGNAIIGYVNDYMKVDTDGETVSLKALNGCTLYYTVSADGYSTMTQLEEPTLKSNCLTPGQTTTFSCYDYGKGDLYLKVKGYKNGKLIILSYESHYMIEVFPWQIHHKY